MKKLHFKDNFKNFLFDLEDYVTIYEKNFHVFNYQKLDKLTSTEIIICMNNLKIDLSGTDLKIKKMSKQELLINGIILKVEFIYD